MHSKSENGVCEEQKSLKSLKVFTSLLYNKSPLYNTDMAQFKRLKHGPHPISKLQLVRSEHDDVIVEGQDALGLDLLVGVEAVAEPVLLGLYNLQGLVDLGPALSCKNTSESYSHNTVGLYRQAFC